MILRGDKLADILLSYIIIKNDDTKEKIQDLIDQYMNRTGFSYEDGYYVLGDEKVKFDLKHKPKTNRYYLELFSSTRFNKGIEIMQSFDDCLYMSDFRRFATVYRDYDGISAVLSEKLYPLYTKYERGLRRMILIVLSKAFGVDCVKETVTPDQMKNVKSNSKGKISGGDISEILEYFDLKQLEDYLFLPHAIDCIAYIGDELSEKKIKKMNKDEICRCIDKMRPKSLWEKEFNEIGTQEEWEKLITQVHDCRNKVAHHRKIRVEEYKYTNKQLKVLNKKIEDSISKLYTKEFSVANSANVLSGFGLALYDLSKSMNVFRDNSDVIIGVSQKIHDIMNSLTKSLSTDNIEMFKRISSNMAEIIQKGALMRQKSDEWNKICENIANTIDTKKIIDEYSRINMGKPVMAESTKDNFDGIGDSLKESLTDDE